jgi:YHS domain-containing protein
MRYLVEILSWLVLFMALRSVVRNIIIGYRQSGLAPRARSYQPPPAPTGGELHKDPVCGTYVSPQASVTRTVRGRVFYFCSPECRDRYLAG